MNFELLCHWTDLLFLKLSLLLLSLYYIMKKDLSTKSLKIFKNILKCLKINDIIKNKLTR